MEEGNQQLSGVVLKGPTASQENKRYSKPESPVRIRSEGKINIRASVIPCGLGDWLSRNREVLTSSLLQEEGGKNQAFVYQVQLRAIETS